MCDTRRLLSARRGKLSHRNYLSTQGESDKTESEWVVPLRALLGLSLCMWVTLTSAQSFGGTGGDAVPYPGSGGAGGGRGVPGQAGKAPPTFLGGGGGGGQAASGGASAPLGFFSLPDATGGAGGTGTHVDGSGDTVGNAGGNGVSLSSPYRPTPAGSGGGGGAAAFSGDGSHLNPNAAYRGGRGGSGGSGIYVAPENVYVIATSGGGGGAGGNGADVTTGTVILNSGARIIGGAGGGGHTFAQANVVAPGGAGDGGAGIHLGTGTTLQNRAGLISGGAGGLGGHQFDVGLGPATLRGADGAGGVGVLAEQGATIVTAGNIVGGLGGDGATRAAAIRLLGSDAQLELQTGSTIVGYVDATSGKNNTLVLGGTTNASFDLSDIGASAQYRGFSQFRKTGNSLWILTGTSTAITPWSIDGGTLEIGAIDSPAPRLIGDVQVNAAGTLRGHGTVTGNVTNNGIVRPGGSIGILTINGNYTQSTAAALAFDISPTQASQLVVSATATLAGTLQLMFSPGTYAPTTYRLIVANSIAGRFSSVVSNTPANLALNIAASPNGLDASLVRPADTVADDPAVAPVAPIVIPPTNATIFGATTSAAIRQAQRVNDALLRRLGKDCLLAAQRADCRDPASAGWVQVAGQQVRTRGNDHAPAYDSRAVNLLAGVDHKLSEWTTGVAAGYSHIDAAEDTGSKGTIDALRVAAYASRWVGPVNIAGDVGYAYDFLSTTRSFAELGKAQADGNAHEFQAGMQASLPVSVGAFVVTPRVGARFAYYHGQSFTEHGPTSQNLNVGNVNLRSLQPYAELSTGVLLDSPNDHPAMVEVHLGYAYETMNNGRDVAVTSGDGTGFVIAGISPSRHLLSVGVEARLPLSNRLDLDVGFDALIATSNTSGQSGHVGLAYHF